MTSRHFLFVLVPFAYAVTAFTAPAAKLSSTSTKPAAAVATPKPAPKPPTPKVVPPSQYFVVQNIATEKTRVYERCTTTPDCPHRMVFEADMVVGRPEEGTSEDPDSFKTWVGHAKISSWVKFYQDRSAHYPHWYKAGQDLNTLPPKAGRDRDGNPVPSLSWGNAWRVKENGHETMYGAFGWYAAMLTPEVAVNQQWMHGTIGWASDGEAAIHLTRSTLLNIFSNPGSSGCTRLSNASIAYLRHLLSPGTDIYRVYARESSRVPDCVRHNWLGKCYERSVNPAYANQTKPFAWDYIMLTDGAQTRGGLTADARTIEAQNIAVVPGVNLIERGTAYYDQYPNPVQPNYAYEASKGVTGDRYQIDSPYGGYPTKFHGYFLVDEGRFINYAHPTREETGGRVITGGMDDFKTTVPEVLVGSGNHTPPEILYKRQN